MQIKLTHKKEFHSSISNGHGHNISVDNNTDVNPKGPSPMELVLMGVAGCSSIGIVRILKQQKIYRAVDLTFKKYCSVSLTFSRSVKMYYYVFINNKQILN